MAVINGTGNSDSLFGTANGDFITSGAGNDFLAGSSGNDVLIAGSGNDIVIGGSGNDILVGGAGNDIFFLGVGEGQDNILDFQVGSDLIALSGGLSFGQLNFIQSGSDTLISLTSSGEVLASLTGIDLNQINNSSNFTAINLSV